MFYDIRKRKPHGDINQLSNLRTNIYNIRVTSNVTKQFEEVHGRPLGILNPVSNQNHMSDEEGLKRAYDSPNRYYHHRNKLCVAGAEDFRNIIYTT